ncbi:MAG: hypothetical protein LBD88_04865 [Candidatus Peribacteria bacterium]|nr:hypothetical protein [Candidatus Peribacteria bacterium]
MVRGQSIMRVVVVLNEMHVKRLNIVGTKDQIGAVTQRYTLAGVCME